MVFLCYKRGVTTLKLYPETISPPLLLDSAALPSHPSPAGNTMQLEEVSVSETENQEVLQIP